MFATQTILNITAFLEIVPIPAMAQSNDIYSRAPTFHDTEAAYILPNEYAPLWRLPCCLDPCKSFSVYNKLIVILSAAEQSRLLDQHDSLVALVRERIVHAPITSPDIILDIGCGTGIITRYLSSHFPTAQRVYGIDLSPVPAQPGDDSASNMSFIQGNFRTLVGIDPRLQFESADFVFSRLLLCGMTDWAGYVRDALKMLKPGCWAEMGDFVEDVFYTDNRSVPRQEWEWLRSIRAGGVRLGLDLDSGFTIRRYMEDAGFVDIQRWEYRIPYWRAAGKEHPETRKMTEHLIGDRWGLYWHMFPKLLDGMGYSDEDMERLRTEMRKDLQEEEGKYQMFCVTIGRKPNI